MQALSLQKKIIAFEGIDGSGKSTQAKKLATYLTNLSVPVHFTFEPTKHMVGQILREIITGKLQATEEIIAGLFIADRLDHITNPDYGMLKHALAGNWIIMDRYYLSSYAYNGLHVGLDWVISANAKSAELMKPDMHFFIDVEPEIAMQRISANREGIDRYESQQSLQAVRNLYFQAMEKTKTTENYILINGNQAEDAVFAEILSVLNKKA